MSVELKLMAGEAISPDEMSSFLAIPKSASSVVFESTHHKLLPVAILPKTKIIENAQGEREVIRTSPFTSSLKLAMKGRSTVSPTGGLWELEIPRKIKGADNKDVDNPNWGAIPTIQSLALFALRPSKGVIWRRDVAERMMMHDELGSLERKKSLLMLAHLRGIEVDKLTEDYNARAVLTCYVDDEIRELEKEAAKLSELLIKLNEPAARMMAVPALRKHAAEVVGKLQKAGKLKGDQVEKLEASGILKAV